MRYVIDENGGFEGMDDVAQCVLIAVAQLKPSGRIDPREQNKQKQLLRERLATLTAGPEPIITIHDIVFTDDKRQTSNLLVTYTNNLTNTQQSTEPEV